MERLTEIQSAGYDLKELNSEWCNKYCEKQKAYTCNECGIYQAIQKLAQYEDLEEQGLILRLPCKVGTTVYLIKSDGKIVSTTADMMFLGTLWEDYGKEWFLTREEAEQKLKEMESDNKSVKG